MPATGFHPRYKLSFKNDRDSQSQQHNLNNVIFNLGDRLEVATSASTRQRKSRNVDQKTEYRQSSSTITYQLTDEVALKSNLALDFNQNKGRGDTRTVTTDNFDLGTAFDVALPDDATLKFDLLGGSTGNQNPFFVSRGIQGKLKSDFAYAPGAWMNVSMNYEGERSNQNSTNRDNDLETQDRETDNKVRGDVTFQLPTNGSLRVSTNMDFGTFQRPDTTGADTTETGAQVVHQETKTLNNRSLSLSSTLNPNSSLQLTLDGNVSRNLTDYVIQTNAYALNRDRGGKVGFRYTLPTATEVGFSFSSRRTNRTFHPDSTQANRSGRTDYRSLVSSLSQRIGQVAKVDLSGKIDLQAETYDDKAFDQDKDILDKRFTVGASYDALTFLKPSFDFTFRENESIFLLASRSSQNNVAQTYSLKPKFVILISPTVSITQTYGLDATYTEYTFDEEKNSVSRIASLLTSFNYSLSSRVKLTTSYDFRDSDNGTLTREGSTRLFDRQSETQKQELTVKMDYTAAQLLNISVSSRLQLERRFRFQDEKRQLQNESTNQYLTGEVRGKLTKGDHLNMNYNVGFNLGDGPRVPASQESYWTSSVDLAYTY